MRFVSDARVNLARVVVVVGWLALFATSPLTPPEWLIASELASIDLDVPAVGERAFSVIVRIEGHPRLMERGVFLVFPPSTPTEALDEDGGAGSLDPGASLVVEAVGRSLLPTRVLSHNRWYYDVHARDDIELDPDSVCFVHPLDCEGATSCELGFVVRARASSVPWTQTLTFWAGSLGYDDLEPPPGRVRVVRVEALP